MWSFKSGHSTLQVMLMMLMVPMVCSASVCKPDQRKMILRKIETTVQKLIYEKLNNIMVVKPLPDVHNCPENFFCLAEKVLENATEENVDIKKLTTYFRQYNTYCSTNCTLEKGHRYRLKRFLTEVRTCALLFLNNKPQKK